MPSQESRSEYTRRFHRVLEHVDRHIDQPLDLDALASVANFSAFHFHRVFAAWMGETAAEYVRRRRIELGALRLATQPRSTVLEVALSVGFTSGEAFARAFRSRFGSTPSDWRREDRKNRQANRNFDQETNSSSAQLPASHSHHVEATMKVTLVERTPVLVAYMRHVGPYGAPVSEFWRTVVAPWMMTNGLFGRVRYGVSHDDPSITSADNCRYDACVEVDESFRGSGDYQVTTLPGGRYATTRFSGTVGEIEGVWAELLREWLPSSGMQLDARPFFEHYPIDARYDPQTGIFECNLCLPVASL